MFIVFTDFIGSQLKESFEHYKRLKLQKRKVRNDRYYASRFYKSQSQNKQKTQKYDAVRQRNRRLNTQNNKDRKKEF